MRRLLLAIALAFVAASAVTLAETGRWKDDGNGGCYWDGNDSGPDQCSPVSGRWKDDGNGGCYWDANDSGPHQCEPPAAPSDPPSGVSVPYYDETYDAQSQELEGLGYEVSNPSCTNFRKNGNVGYIGIDRLATGTITWGAYMHKAWQDYGWWSADVYVNSNKFDGKTQAYPPHGTIPAASAPVGSNITVVAVHFYPELRWVWTPTWVPEFGRFFTIPVPSYFVTFAYGYATCTVTVP
jgi:hypothetical protein